MAIKSRQSAILPSIEKDLKVIYAQTLCPSAEARQQFVSAYIKLQESYLLLQNTLSSYLIATNKTDTQD